MPSLPECHDIEGITATSAFQRWSETVDVRNPEVGPDLGTPFEPAEDVHAVVTER